MTDLFNPEKNYPRPKVEGRGVRWAGLNYIQCERDGILEEIQEHILKMDDEKASNYARFLVNNAGFPPHYFNSMPNVVLKLN